MHALLHHHAATETSTRTQVLSRGASVAVLDAVATGRPLAGARPRAHILLAPLRRPPCLAGTTRCTHNNSATGIGARVAAPPSASAVPPHPAPTSDGGSTCVITVRTVLLVRPRRYQWYQHQQRWRRCWRGRPSPAQVLPIVLLRCAKAIRPASARPRPWPRTQHRAASRDPTQHQRRGTIRSVPSRAGTGPRGGAQPRLAWRERACSPKARCELQRWGCRQRQCGTACWHGDAARHGCTRRRRHLERGVPAHPGQRAPPRAQLAVAPGLTEQRWHRCH